jgi:CRP/FNR family transcriptional regulator
MRGVKQKFKKGEYIIRPGESPPGIFYIKKGLVKAYDITRYQEENLLIIRKDAELFPIIWALTGQERSVIYQTLEPTITYRISRKTFLNNLQNNPSTLSSVLDMTVEMYRLHSERILNLEYRTVRERLISFLLTTSDRFGINKIKNQITINVPLRHQDIASSINSSRETTSRELSALEKKGLISTSRQFITIKDLKTFKKYVT